MTLSHSEYARIFSINGKTYPGSVAAGDALERKGFVYAFSTEGETFYYHKHHEMLAAIVDDACNQHGYKVELTQDERWVGLARSGVTER